MTTKYCEWCGKPLPIRPNEIHRPSHYLKRRFCNHWCAAQWKNKDRRVQKQCEVCGKTFWAIKSQPTRRFCSNACYLVYHAAERKTCPTCGREFVSYDRRRIYCSRPCVPMKGEANPNYGKRHPKMFRHSAEVRLRLSESRLGHGNPRWKGGTKNNGRYRMQTWVNQWMKEHVGDRCEVCGEAPAHVHHIVARRLFPNPIMAHFRQNLVMLCTKHHAEADRLARQALQERRVHDLPFADRLPQSILAQLAQGGSVSRLTAACDFSPLGTAAQLAIRPEWYDDTSSQQASSGHDGSELASAA